MNTSPSSADRKRGALPPAVLSDDIRHFEQRFWVADEDMRVTRQLVALLQQITAGGRQIHDANPVATMQVYGIDKLLTHNVDDFVRFAGIVTINSWEVLGQ